MYMHVVFNLDKNETFYTYSNQEYDRMQIDSVMYKRCYNKISNEEWEDLIRELNFYKLNEMQSHKNELFTKKVQSNELFTKKVQSKMDNMLNGKE